MPSYTVNDGHRAVIDGKLVEGGAKITLDAAVGDPLVESGVLVSNRRAPATPERPRGGRRSAWTPNDDGDDSEGD